MTHSEALEALVISLREEVTDLRELVGMLAAQTACQLMEQSHSELRAANIRDDLAEFLNTLNEQPTLAFREQMELEVAS